MKGQVKVEFILGIVVFALVVLYVGGQIGTAFNSAGTDARIDMLKSKSISMLNMILLDPSVGLSVEPNVLDQATLIAWNQDAIDNELGTCPQLDSFDLGGYRLVVNDGTNDILFCGYVGLSQIRTTTMRKCIINSNPIKYGTITLEMW